MSTANLEKNALLWIGEQKSALKKDRSSDLVMDSVFNYYKDEEPQLTYRVKKLFLDNGAFTARMKGIELDIARVMFIQEEFDPFLTIPLDYPFQPGMTALQMADLWKKTSKNICYWQSSSNLKGRLVPALHAWSKKTLVENVSWLQKNADSEYLALGSVVYPSFEQYTGFFGDRQPRRELIDMLCQALGCIERNSDFKVHLMGFGSSPLMLHLGYYLGIISTDTSGYRRKAAYGKIILPGTGERNLGGTSRFGIGRPIKEDDPKCSHDIQLLEKCTCPICIANKYQLWSDWKARATHNEHVMKNEAKKAERFLSLGIDVYEKFLDNVVFANSSLKYLWEYAKFRRKYYRISNVLFEGKY